MHLPLRVAPRPQDVQGRRLAFGRASLFNRLTSGQPCAPPRNPHWRGTRTAHQPTARSPEFLRAGRCRVVSRPRRRGSQQLVIYLPLTSVYGWPGSPEPMSWSYGEMKRTRHSPTGGRQMERSTGRLEPAPDEQSDAVGRQDKIEPGPRSLQLRQQLFRRVGPGCRNRLGRRGRSSTTVKRTVAT